MRHNDYWHLAHFLLTGSLCAGSAHHCHGIYQGRKAGKWLSGEHVMQKLLTIGRVVNCMRFTKHFLIGTEGALRIHMTYDNHPNPIPSIHPTHRLHCIRPLVRCDNCLGDLILMHHWLCFCDQYSYSDQNTEAEAFCSPWCPKMSQICIFQRPLSMHSTIARVSMQRLSTSGHCLINVILTQF